MARLVLATCQFHVHNQPERNLRSAIAQIETARVRAAHLVHFSEACLSGYLGVEIDSHDRGGWDRITAAMEEVAAAARRHRVWVVVGCNHRLSGSRKPHNSLYVIDTRGRIVSRYDKMFCTGSASGKDGDLAHYSPGEALITFRARGLTCGLLICHDFRYPELFREYKRRGVDLMLVSFHNAGGKKESCDKYKITVPATLQAAAASNYYAVSANNGTRRYAWPSFVVNAEGVIVNKAPQHRPSVLITEIDTAEKLYDASADWRDRCMRGVLHSGRLVRDARSRERTAL